ncbi:MAG: glucosidase [Frankiales bacterium]|nr:glucosidase [Frankiales bacterium]
MSSDRRRGRTRRAAPAPESETDRLRTADAGVQDWRRWGPYLAERAWGTVREDYSADGNAWDYFPHDHARSRAYRWNEDGMAGVCDLDQTLCLSLALWNGVDPILKERMFGLAGPEGNHGEDVKEYWSYDDSTPTHSWMTWRYHYPQQAYPYDELVAGNRDRGRDQPEFELADTGIFDHDRYWAVTVDYAKAAPDDILMRITVENRGPEAAVIHVLPTLWFRNTWAWGDPNPSIPVIREQTSQSLLAEHPVLGPMTLTHAGVGEPLFCDNETNAHRLFGSDGRSPYPKDGINDHVVGGAPTVNPALQGTRSALHHVLEVAAGGHTEVRVRLTAGQAMGDLGADFDDVLLRRKAEADTFYTDLTPASLTDDEALVLRRSLAGLLWGKQFYRFDVERWLDGDPGGPPTPLGRTGVRNGEWRHLSAHDVISMPDPWEYPWFAAWDLAFHCVPLAHIDPAFAKSQLLLLLREWYQHPSGQIPAYEWSFGDVNPPVHAWAALQVFHCTDSSDVEWLERVFHKLLLNFTWWVNRKDSRGVNVFGGGFLGMDNIGAFDRSSTAPEGQILEQSDGTAWMASYCLDMLEIALVLAEHDATYEDLATKFVQHFAYIATAARTQGLWDDQDGFFYDQLLSPDGTRTPLRIRSLVGLLPLVATTTIGRQTLERLPAFAAQLEEFTTRKPGFAAPISVTHVRDGHEGRLLSMVDPQHLVQVLGSLLDEEEFLTPFGVRSLSRRHQDSPFVLQLPGLSASVGYEPGESPTPIFGGNSNWRGPIWFPMNVLLVQSLKRFARLYGDDLHLACPTGSPNQATLSEIADDVSRRLVSMFLLGADGRRPGHGADPLFARDPGWRDMVPFFEYFHGDSGAGLGASHQTGWTALVAELLLHRES